MVRTALLIGRKNVCRYIRQTMGPRDYRCIGWSYFKGSTPQDEQSLRAKFEANPIDIVVIGAGLPEDARQSVATLCQSISPTARIEMRPMPSPTEREQYNALLNEGKVNEAVTSTVGPLGTIVFMDNLMAELDSPQST